MSGLDNRSADDFTVSDPLSLPQLSSFDLAKTERNRLRMKELGKRSLYFLTKVILGYDKLNKRVHGPMCRFAVEAEYLRRMMLMPRSHYKTTIWTIADTIRRILLDPNIRILIVADTATNASRFLREIEQHFEFNEVFRWLYPELIPESFSKALWSQTEMRVPRSRIAGAPTVTAIGAMGGAESQHFDLIKADDLVTEKCIRSEVEMDNVIHWAGGLESLLVAVNTGQIDFIGSRKKKGDLYEVQQKAYSQGAKTKKIGPFASLVGEMSVFTRSAIENGSVIFPENISLSFLTRLRKYDPERYHAQYANSPKGTGLNTFDIDNLRYYKWTEEGRIMCVEDGKVVEVFSPWSVERLVLFDPAKAEKKSNSKQAIHVICMSPDRRRIVLETRVGHYLANEAIEYLFELQEKWSPSFFSIEARGFQGWVKYWLEEKAEREKRPYLQVLEWPPQGHPSAQWAKTEHIRGLQPIVRANLLWVHETMTDLIDDIEFYPNVRWDDSLDALAQGLTYWPFSVDEVEVRKRKTKELEYLDLIAAQSAYRGIPIPPASEQYDRAWDEQEFLRQFDATGYGIVRA